MATPQQIKITKEYTTSTKEYPKVVLRVGEVYDTFIPMGGNTTPITYAADGGKATTVNVPVGYYEMYEKPTDKKKENLKADKNVRTIFLGIVIIGLFSFTLINKFKK